MRRSFLNRLQRRVLPLAVLLLLLEAAWACDRFLTVRAVARELATRRHELGALAAEHGTRRTGEGAGESLGQARELVRTAQEQWQGRGPLAQSPEPRSALPTRAEAFFELAQFVDEMRELAKHEDVALVPGERFGFAAYANVGPPPELMSEIARQKLTLRAMLPLLFQARPARILAVRRERPVAATAPDLTRLEETAASERDYFEPSRLGCPVEIKDAQAGAYQLVFASETGALRDFLNALARSELPLIVSSVEAEPMAGGERTAQDGRHASQFTVTVVRIELPVLNAVFAAK